MVFFLHFFKKNSNLSSTFSLFISSIGIVILSSKQEHTLNILGMKIFPNLTASGIISFICCAINP